jgi:putative chitinase
MEMPEFLAWLESREGAAVSAAWWWQQHGCNELADAGTFEALTRRINGGVNGLADRGRRWDAARKALSI